VYFGIVGSSRDAPGSEARRADKPEWMSEVFAGGFRIAVLVVSLSLANAVGGSHLLDTIVATLVGGLLSANLIWRIPRNRFTQDGPTYWERHFMKKPEDEG